MASFQSFFLSISPSSLFVHLYLLACAEPTSEPKSPKTQPSFQTSTDNRSSWVMATLQRSAKSFRRQDSSGLVWDNSLWSDQPYEGAKNDKSDLKELRPCQSARALSAGVDYSSGPEDATPPATCLRSLSSLGANPSQRAYSRSLSGVFGKQYLVKKLKMGKTTDP